MVKFNTAVCIEILIYFLVAVDLSVPYQMLSLENDKVCLLPTKQVVTLGANSLSGLVVTLTNVTKLKEHTLNWQKDFICEFQVNTSIINKGLFVVIQNIVFRSDDKTNECLDYVEYRRNNFSTSKRYCGQINMDFASPIDATNLAPTINSFVEPSGVLDVYIYISKKPLKLYRKLELEVVFTSYRHCFRSSSQEDQQCSVKYSAHCIYKNFFNDGYINCPYPGCVDETACSVKFQMQDKDKDSRGFKIAITSVAVMLIICALVTFYMCRKFKKFCWAEDFDVPRNTYQPAVELATRDQPNAYTIVASAPASGSHKDDSLPPSYNSLFPDT